uniref:Neurexin/syndecan/glycophorin C domain-containing protein n=1 Tax=Cyprinodon variegatus TaxID=28743 RepID=A0A3Q2C771_CYPVA
MRTQEVCSLLKYCVIHQIYAFCHCFLSDPNALGQHGPDHALIGGVVAVVVFITLCLIIVLGRYLARHKGTYLTHEAKGAEDAPDADTAIINAEGNHVHAEEKKEYFI